MARPNKFVRSVKFVLHRGMVLCGAVGMTLALFLVLPLMQTIANKDDSDMIVRSIDPAKLPPPPPPPEEEPPEEEEPEEEPPKLEEEAPPLDLSQLEMALSTSGGGDWGFDFKVELEGVGGGKGVDALFSSTDLDQKPRAIFKPLPTPNAKTRKKAPGTVVIVFTVNERGRVENPVVLETDDPVFDRPALTAVKQWRFEPGKSDGKAVSFRMKVPITFPK